MKQFNLMSAGDCRFQMRRCNAVLDFEKGRTPAAAISLVQEICRDSSILAFLLSFFLRVGDPDHDVPV